MNNIFALYMIMLVAYFLLQSGDTYQIERVFGKKAYRVKPLYAVLFILPLVIFAWQRSLSIGDSYTYTQMFSRLPDGLDGLIKYLEQYPKDPGFTIFAWLIKAIGFSYREMFLVVALIQIASLVYVYRKYSSNYYLTMLLFLISTDYISWMNNGIRQFMAVTIIFAATTWIIEKKYLRTILVILFASSFHQSALLMIPVIFIVQGEALNSRMLTVFVVFMISVIFVSAFTDILDSGLQETQYSNMVTDYTEGEFTFDDGTNPLRVLVYSIPLLLFLVLKIRGCKTVPKIINLSVNMSLFSVGFYLISMATSGIFIGRIPIYFSLYNYILIPWELKKLFVKSQTRIVVGLTMTLYLIFSLVQYHGVWAF